jgi:predicted phage tail protein
LWMLFASAMGCQALGQAGPVVWIDRPLEGMHAQDGPVIITAHASTAGGVQGVEFFAGDQQIGGVQGDGSSFFEAQIEWQPPAPGKYTLRVHALDKDGKTGPDATVNIQVGGEISPTPPPALQTGTPTPAVLTKAPTPTPAKVTATLTHEVSPTAKKAPSFTPTLTIGVPALTANADANCRSGPDTYFDVDDVLKKGMTVPIEARSPDDSWVYIREPSGWGGHCWVSVSVGVLTGNLHSVPVRQGPAVPTTPVPVEPTQTEEIIVVVPPQVSISLADAQLLTNGNPCTNHPTTTIATAHVNSIGTISSVMVYWDVNGESGSAVMRAMGGGNYQTTIGPFNNYGTGRVWAQAVNALNQQGISASVAVDVSSACVQ